MKELDLMYALEGAGNDMLLEAEELELHARRRPLLRIALIAAVMALLSATVYAISSETRISFPNEENSVIFNDFEVDGITYSHVEIEYDLQPVAIKEKAVDFLTDMIDQTGYWVLEGNELIACTSNLPHTFESIDKAENFFGLSFDLPEIVREGTVAKRKVTMYALPEYFPEDLPPEAAWEYDPDLGGAKLSFNVTDLPKHIDSMHIKIFIGLTEEYTAFPATGGWFIPLELLGEPVIQEIKLGDEEFTVLTYSDNPENNACTFYVRDGIGYSLSFYTADDFTGDPVKLIRPYLKDLG